MVHEVVDENEFHQLIGQKGKLVVVDFSATWCGPCKMVAPAYDALALKYPTVVFLKVMEGNNRELIMSQGVQAFPTFSFYIEGRKVDEVRGARITDVESKVIQHMASVRPAFDGAGFSLGGTGAISEKDARAARLARFGAYTSGSSEKMPSQSNAALNAKILAADTGDDDPRFHLEQPEPSLSPPPLDEFSKSAPSTSDAPVALREVDLDILQQLTDDMGFLEGRARRALCLAPESGLEAAITWLMEHQEDPDVDDPLPEYIEAPRDDSNRSASSLKCDDCRILLKDMVAAELHAHKSGHSNFSESTQEITPLTAEEKAAKVALLKEKLAARRLEREEAEKIEGVSREKSRRTMGKEMRATREEMDAQARMRDIQLRKKEKLDAQRERERLREEIAKDKAERKSRGGKLAGKLGVEGYQPVGLQQTVQSGDRPGVEKVQEGEDAGIEQIAKAVNLLSRQKVGSEGGIAMKTILLYVNNILNNPTEEKYHSIGLENKAFKARVSGCIGGIALLKAIGFEKQEGEDGGSRLVLDMLNKDKTLLLAAKNSLEKAISTYNP